MISFEVWINGKIEFTVGFKGAEEFGVYLSHNPELHNDFASLEASGYAQSDAEFTDEIKWGNRSIRQGDEVIIKLVNSESPDEPSRTRQNIGLIPDAKNAMLCSNCGKTHFQIERLIRAERITLCNECVDTIIEVSRDVNET